MLIVIHPKDITDKAQFALDQSPFAAESWPLWIRLCISDTQRQQPNPMGFKLRHQFPPPKLSQGLGDTSALDPRWSPIRSS